MRRGRWSEIACEAALCSDSGATTQTSPSGSMAAKRAWIPGAPWPSSLETRITGGDVRGSAIAWSPPEGAELDSTRGRPRLLFLRSDGGGHENQDSGARDRVRVRGRGTGRAVPPHLPARPLHVGGAGRGRADEPSGDPVRRSRLRGVAPGRRAPDDGADRR